jgi:2-iminobutanoate/2-iminopropanoate deaminase
MGSLGGGSFELAEGGTAGQTRQALCNLEQVLVACDAALEDLVKVTVYLSDLSMFPEMDQAYSELVTTAPARVTIGCSLSAGAAVELDATAYRRPS